MIWRPLGVLVCASFLGGCAVPVPIQIASWALDGLSFLVTKKSVSDHGISLIANRDCALYRAVTEGSPCRDEPYDLAALWRLIAGEEGKSVAAASSVGVTARRGIDYDSVEACRRAQVDPTMPSETYFLLATFPTTEEASQALDACAALDQALVFVRIGQGSESRLVVWPLGSGDRAAVLSALEVGGFRQTDRIALANEAS